MENKLDEKYSQHIKLPNTPTEILYEKRKNILKDIFLIITIKTSIKS